MAKATYSLLEKAKARLLADLRHDIRDEQVLAAMARVPREKFVSDDLRAFAYENRPLPIGHGQTISQPLIVAMMTEALDLTGDEKVLELGTGSGYQAAILAELTERVVTVERIAPLAERAAAVLAELGYDNVQVRLADDTIGCPEEAPYDAILVTAAAPDVPPALIEQLATQGRLVIPVGAHDVQELLLITNSPSGFTTKRLGPCRFVPLVGAGGWPTTDFGFPGL
jgi:protein-L-isoaspartate(D-aspartate) O-methyltransferase